MSNQFQYNYEKRHEKTRFSPMQNKGADETAQLISAFVFATRIEQFLFFLNLKFQASIILVSLYRPVCVRPGQKPQRPVFLRRGSYMYVGHSKSNAICSIFLCIFI